MIDFPEFPPPFYPKGFEGTKTFVTTVKDVDGDVLKVVHWHVTQFKNGKTIMKIDS
jgi:phosphatidylethanolamine-binding protein (PEBP) family uncharacterized protein